MEYPEKGTINLQDAARDLNERLSKLEAPTVVEPVEPEPANADENPAG